MIPLWLQWIPDQKTYNYHLSTIQKSHNKPTYRTLRASHERMKTQAEGNEIRQYDMPLIDCDLDKLGWNVAR